MKHSLLHYEIDMEVYAEKILDLKRKIKELETYLTPGCRIPLLSNDTENPPEIFVCPITYVSCPSQQPWGRMRFCLSGGFAVK